MKKLLWCLLIVPFLQPLPALAFIYFAQSIEGWVTDAESGKPLEGVIVVAHWQLKGGFEGGVPVRQLQIFETVTDQNGRYHFPGWGPKFALSGHLKSESPGILLFKPGYRYLALGNEWYSGKDLSKSDWNGKTVKLERFKGSLGDYAEHLSSLSGSLESVGYGTGRESGDWCGWQSFPRMLRALDTLEGEFRAAGVRQGTVVSFLRNNEARIKQRGCASVSELLGAGK
jgi:hypothetical protein